MPNPPKTAQRFLSWFIKDELLEEVLGDLEEKFDDQMEELFTNDKLRKNLSENFKKLAKPNATADIVTEIIRELALVMYGLNSIVSRYSRSFK